jgi:hypothetical protein
MLLDWPEQKGRLREALHETVRALAHQGIVAEVPALTLYEGNRAVFVYPDGQRQDWSFTRAEAQATLEKKDVSRGSHELAVKAVRELAGGLGDQMEKDLIALMQKSDARHGGMFGGADDEAMFEDLMRGLREMELSFEDDGSPSLFFVVHPDNAMKLQTLNAPERKEIFDRLIEEKRREWLRRESNRRLVD